MYTIMARSRWGTEEIDEAPTLEEAHRLVGEYRMAYGAGWSIWVKGE